MQGLMMDYQLTLDRILEHANRMFPHKHVRTKLPDGSFHSYTYADLYRRVKRLANVLEGLGVARVIVSVPLPGTTISISNSTTPFPVPVPFATPSTSGLPPTSLRTLSIMRKTRLSLSMVHCCLSLRD